MYKLKTIQYDWLRIKIIINTLQTFYSPSKIQKNKDNRSTIVSPQFSIKKSGLQLKRVCFSVLDQQLQVDNANTEFF